MNEENKFLQIEKFKNLIEDRKPKKVAIFAHAFPDPDAIGSMMGIKWLLDKLNIASNLYYTGSISHPQNRSMVNLLDPELILLDNIEDIDFSDYFNILVDSIPSNAGTFGHGVNFDVVIDHHKETPSNFNGVFINLKAGSCCGTIFQIIKSFGFAFDEDLESDNKVATSMMVGITTDTEFLTSDDCSDYEFEAWSKLFPCRDSSLLRQIINFERPKFWTEAKALACSKVTIEDSVGVVGIGMIPLKHRDMIADMADDMVTWEDVNTSVVFAIIDGVRIEGSVRTKTSSISVPALCQDLGGKYGKGGGKLGKGAYRYDLAGASIDEDEDEDFKEKAWNLFQEKETKRVFKIIKNK
jgi:nanoRNase/pAp phosphatase (c-di-AMP/oligoRNAs hydrolase)